MMRFGRFALISLSSITLLSLPRVAAAQRFVAFAGGTNVAQGPALPSQNLSTGLAAQASVGFRVTSRLRVRFDALVSRFHAVPAPGTRIALPVCYCGGGGALAEPPTGPVGVTALVVNELFDILPAKNGAPGFHLIAGGGAYYMFQNPTAPTLMRVGLSGGAGLEVPLGSSSALVFEARYHELINAPADARWLVPVTLGMRF